MVSSLLTCKSHNDTLFALVHSFAAQTIQGTLEIGGLNKACKKSIKPLFISIKSLYLPNSSMTTTGHHTKVWMECTAHPLLAAFCLRFLALHSPDSTFSCVSDDKVFHQATVGRKKEIALQFLNNFHMNTRLPSLCHRRRCGLWSTQTFVLSLSANQPVN